MRRNATCFFNPQPKKADAPVRARARVAAHFSIISLLSALLFLSGCFAPTYPQKDREVRVLEAAARFKNAEPLPSVLTPEAAVAYALRNNLEAKAAEIDAAYQTESLAAARLRLLPAMNLGYSMEDSNHPAARWSQSTVSGNQSLESSYSAEPNVRQAEIGAVWNLIDFGVGYLRSRQQGERARHSREQLRRVRQQVTLETLAAYWRAAAAMTTAAEAETLGGELAAQAEAVRDAVEMRILSAAEGARRELAVHNGIAEIEQWRRTAELARMELRRALGAGGAGNFTLPAMTGLDGGGLPAADAPPLALQAAALRRRPELFQHDTQERIAVDEARLALLQIAPNASLSFTFHDDPDKFLEWSNWMTAGVRATWNLFNIPARLAERRAAKLQGETARQRSLALAAAVMAQVGISYSDVGLSRRHAAALATRSAARRRLVEALAAGEADGQTRPGEVLLERVRLLAENAAALRAASDAQVAAARLANAVGLDVDDGGRFVWGNITPAPATVGAAAVATAAAKETSKSAPAIAGTATTGAAVIATTTAAMPLEFSEATAAGLMPDVMAGLRVVKAEEFLTPATFFISGGEGN